MEGLTPFLAALGAAVGGFFATLLIRWWWRPQLCVAAEPIYSHSPGGSHFIVTVCNNGSGVAKGCTARFAIDWDIARMERNAIPGHPNMDESLDWVELLTGACRWATLGYPTKQSIGPKMNAPVEAFRFQGQSIIAPAGQVKFRTEVGEYHGTLTVSPENGSPVSRGFVLEVTDTDVTLRLLDEGQSRGRLDRLFGGPDPRIRWG